MTAAARSPEILILGGGPAGAAAAILLARAGLRVTLVERESEPRHKVCGEFLSDEALQLLASLDVPLDLARDSADGAAGNGPLPVREVRLAYGKGRVATATLPFRAASLSRRSLDATLLGCAAAAGAHLLRGVTVEALHLERGLWHATLSSGEMLVAPHAMLATGKHDLRGFPRPQGTQNDLVALKSYFRLAPDQAAALGGHVELLLHPAGYTGLQAVEGGMANLTALVRRTHLARVGGWSGLLAELRASNAHAALRLRGAEDLLAKPLAVSSIPYGFVREHAIAPCLWAVGDQAAVIPSFTGDGMSIALYSGMRAAEALLRGDSVEEFQPALHGSLRAQVTRATALSRLLVHAPSQAVLATAARVWPGALGRAAAATRLSFSAMEAVRQATAGGNALRLHFQGVK